MPRSVISLLVTNFTYEEAGDCATSHEDCGDPYCGSLSNPRESSHAGSDPIIHGQYAHLDRPIRCKHFENV
jgi:hypothetical protein